LCPIDSKIFSMKKLLLLVVSSLLLLSAFLSGTVPQQERRREQQWIDSVMNTLTLRQRIAQLFVAPVEIIPEKQPLTNKVLELVRKEQLGGVIVMKAHPGMYAKNINALQHAAKLPLLVCIDAEWGVGMRMDSVMPFPRKMMLGAISDNKLIEQMGEAIAGQCLRIGAHMNFAPVVDVNSNPDNPVINIRSFGENKYNVAEKSIAYMRGLQNGGVLACAKHFPGHGDTHQDSHEMLPSISHSTMRMDSVELYPFKALMEAGIDAIMVAHLQVPAYDAAKNRPSTLSHSIVGMLLKDELEFSGLIITDALNMRAVTYNHKRDSLSYAAILAGNDIMLMPDSISASITRIEKAVHAGKLSAFRINTKCRKVLAAKYRAGLNNYRPIPEANLLNDLNNADNEALRYQLTEQALTILVNKDNLLPLRRLDTLKIAYLEIGNDFGKDFKEQLSLYAGFDSFSIEPAAPKDTLVALRKKLEKYNLVIAGWHNTDARPQFNFGVDTVTAQFITDLALRKKVILDFFGTPYGIKKFKDYKNLAALIVSYENSIYSQQRSAQLIFGGIAAKGTLPVSIDNELHFGNGIRQNAPVRLRYVLPEEIGIPQAHLTIIDSLVTHAIAQRATPGAQIVAVHKGNVFYNKAFGKHTYGNTATSATTGDVYDWASLTKISATLPVIMQLHGVGALQIDSTLNTYLPELANTNKKNLVITDLLTHSSGLRAFQPFQTIFFDPNEKIDSAYFANTASAGFPLSVTDKLYASPNVKSFIYRQIDVSPLQSKTYRYSDWGFIYLQRIVESITQRPLDRLADSLFYAPLGMNNTGFLPLQRVAKTRIPPTENDSLYRKQVIRGTVHDPTSALLGGVAGHAGVFGNANDLAKLLQLYLNGGNYGGQHYFTKSVVNKFTERDQSKKANRRGLGFDKPEPDEDKDSPIGREWSLASYGHSGYVGNLCWVDPERELIVVFLSNRSYPNDDKKLNTLGTRSKIFSEFVRIVDRIAE